jgi:hypothetical protein
VMVFFKIGSHGTICPGWLRTLILLMSASWAARIPGLSQQHLTVLGSEGGAARESQEVTEGWVVFNSQDHKKFWD